MKNSIVVDYNPFIMGSVAYIIKNSDVMQKTISSNLIQMPADIVSLCYAVGLYKVTINTTGDTLDEIREKIKEKELSIYSENKIQIEGME